MLSTKNLIEGKSYQLNENFAAISYLATGLLPSCQAAMQQTIFVRRPQNCDYLHTHTHMHTNI